jgi:hypothetical protein
MADFTIEFYVDDHGRSPCQKFIDGLDPVKRLAIIAAIEQILAKQGIEVCKSPWGKQLGHGLFEFRVRHTAEEIHRLFDGDPPAQSSDHEGPPGEVLLRVFCHAYGNRVVLLFGGYDKGADPSPKRQQKEIKTARTRLNSWKQAQQRGKKKR